MSDQRYEKGMEIRRAVHGDAYVDRAEANKTDLDTDFQRFITEGAWGSVWSRPGLDIKTRHMLTIAILASLCRENELTLYFRATRNTGVTQAEVNDVLMHEAAYAGI